MEFSKRMELFGDSVFTVLKNKKDAALAAGQPVTDFSVGAPNIPPAPHILKALIDNAGIYKNYEYAINDLPELLEACAGWYKRRFGVILDPETQITGVLGSQEGLAHIGLSILNEGDLVLVPDPCYPVFACGPAIAGAELYYMPLLEKNNYIIDLDAIPEDIAARAKLMVVSYPNNPTTAVAPEEFYDDLIKFAKKYNIIVIHDNAYSELVFTGQVCGSFLAHEGAFDVGVEFNSLSKTYGLAGARIGFCMGNKEIIKNLRTLKSNMDYGIFLPVQYAAIEAITGDQTCVSETRNAYKSRMEYFVNGMRELGWDMRPSKGTMFIWAKIPEKFSSSQQCCEELLSKAGFLVTPGNAFGPSGEGYVRIALVRTEEEMAEAIHRLGESGVLK